MNRFQTRLCLRNILFLLLCFTFSSTVFSQSLDLENFVITQFGLEEGLPQNSVNDIIQANDGYIWLATFGGLVRFDGHSFTTFNRANTPGMESDRLLKIFAASDGSIWLHPEETETFILRFKDGICTKYPIEDKLAPNIQLFEDSRGTIWLYAFESIWKFEDEGFARMPISTSSELIEEAKKDTAGVWIGAENIILKTVRDSVVKVYDSVLESDSRIIQIIKNPKDPENLLIGSSMDGVTELKEENGVMKRVHYKSPFEYFLTFETDLDKNLFGITAEGLFLKKGDRLEVFDPFSGNKNLKAKNILQDNEGNYWVGTEGNGLFRFRKSIITMIDKDDGLENEKMLSMTQLENGTFLFSTNCGGIFEWKSGRAISSKVQDYYPSGCNWSVFQDSKERIWIGGGTPYMTRALDEPGTNFVEKDGYTGFSVFAMMEDSKGRIWVASGTGIYIFDGERFSKNYTAEDGLYFSHASVLFQDESDLVWVGTKSGLNTIKDGEVSKLELLKGPDGTTEVKQPWVRSIYKDDYGMMWFGTYGNGLFGLKDGKITHLTIQDGLFDDIVSHIVEDGNGNFWMGSNRGIFRVKKEELHKFVNGEMKEVRSYSYGTAEGMNSAETNGGFQPSTVMDSLGNIYFPTISGVAVVSTRDVRRNEVPPPTYIESLRNSEGEISLSSLITLPYDNPFLEINYTAVSFTEPTKVQFKYRMEGLDDSWIDVGNSRSAIYSKIPPGKYTFHVIASNNDGVWNTEGASFEIDVIPPFWETAWFYGIVIFMLLTSGPSVYYYRISKLKKENERKKRFTEQLIDSQENERRRIASELHDGLGQQILVIKNRVEMAQQQAEGSRLELVEQLSEIKISAERSIGDVRNISHGLRPVLLEKFGLTEAITNLCDQLQNTSQIEWSYHIDNIDEMIPSNKEIHFYRVLQEGVKNILNHSSAKEASVIVKKMGNTIQAKIWDDGKGFDVKAMEHFKGLGFLGMNERIETLGGTLQVQSAHNEGAVVTILIPIKEQ